MDEGLNRESSKNVASLRPALAFLLPYKKQILWASIALVVTATVTLSIGQGMRLIIDEGLNNNSQGMLRDSLGVFSLLVLLLTVGTYVRFYFVSWIGERVSADIRQAVFDRLIHLHPAFFELNQPTEIQSRITTDTTLLQTVIGSSVSIALRNVLMFAGGLILLFVTNVKLTLIVVACVPLVVGPIIWFGRRVRDLSRRSQDTLADVGSYAGESLRQIKIVQAFNHQDADQLAFSQRVDAAFDVAIARVRQRAKLIAVVMLLVMGAIAAMLWVGGQDVVAGSTSPGELAAFIFYAFIVAGSVGAISEVYSDLQRAAGATERLMELLGSDSELPVLEQPTVLAADTPGALTLDQVGFTYPSRPNTPVLQDVSFHIAPGEMVAIVGPSGSGKSTLFDLMQRFYDPTIGTVALDGVCVTDLALEDLRRCIGFVPQDPVLFGGTLESNLRYGAPAANVDEINDALAQSHAAEFVAELPDGIQTRIGEGGVGLSGGQKQRLAIARALLSNPKILLLDEATSALDARSEQHIRDSVASLQGKMSIVIVAHRLSTVRQADRILVLVDGKLQASGTHEELLGSNELYAQFAKIQFSESVFESAPENNSSWRSSNG